MLLPISQLRTDGGTQPRASLDEGYIAELAEVVSGGSELEPVTSFHDGSHYWLADGFHRARAYEKAGRRELPAEVKQGTRRDAVLFSVGANATHGLRRSNADKRRAVEVLLRDEEWRRWSDRKIAEVCGVGHPLVADARRQVEESSTSPSPTRTGADGKQYPATRPRPRPAATNPVPSPAPQPPVTDDPEPDDEEEPFDQDDEDLVDEDPEEEPNDDVGPAPEPVAAPPRASGMSDLDVTLACVRGLSHDERSELFRSLGAILCSDLVTIIEQRSRDPEYAQMRRISEPPPNATRAMRQVTAVLDGGDVALAMLGCRWSSSADDVRRAYRAASLAVHPDRGGDPEVMARINWAHGVVRDFVGGKP